MQIGTSGQRGTGTKRSTLGSGGQRSRSHEAEDRMIWRPGGGIILDTLGSSRFYELHIQHIQQNPVCTINLTHPTYRQVIYY